MKLPSTQTLVNDYIWTPLVHVADGQRAFLVHPGTTIKPSELPTGWHWHWPLLTSIRVLNFRPMVVKFGHKQPQGSEFIQDDFITAVSRDHHLFAISGCVEIKLHYGASPTQLAQFNRHSINRVIRPLIRQAVRQATGKIDSRQANPEVINPLLIKILDGLCTPLGLQLISASLSEVKSYQPSLLKEL